MKIGIDLTPLQGPHRMRGIGYTVMCFMNNLPDNEKKQNTYVFFMHEKLQQEALDLIELDDISYEIRDLRPPAPIGHVRRSVWAYKKLRTLLRTLWILSVGNSEGGDFSDIDWFLQFDQNKPLPSKRTVRSLLVLYDLIPYILGHMYLMSYSTARRSGMSRVRALAAQGKRTSYIVKARLITKNAVKLIAISEHTKSDFVKFARVNPKKITVCMLGVSDEPISNSGAPKSLTRYVNSSWGPLPKEVSLPNKPYLLFVGGADPRRKLIDLVAAFNNLRAKGEDVLLILSGDTMFGSNEVGNPDLQAYLKQTAYLDNIYFLGFTDDKTKDWLYRNALAFVFPSIYEGFGLPVLEAMRHGTPVITYDNSSLREVGGKAALFVDSPVGIETTARKLLGSAELKKTCQQRGIAQSSSFSWHKTTKSIFDTLSD